MPRFLTILGYVGTAAMLWVGAEIIAHGIPFLHHPMEALEHALSGVPALAWLAKVVILALGGIVLGFVVEKLVSLVRSIFKGSAEKNAH
jgi:predicted DNA repair protein MutK